MQDIAFHIADIAVNGISAGADNMVITVRFEGDMVAFEVSDNGGGMMPEEVEAAKTPFYTTRITRRFGFGIPFLMQNAEQCGGTVKIESIKGRGTLISAGFNTKNINCPTLGKLGETLMLIISGNPEVNITVSFQSEAGGFETSSALFAADGLIIGLPETAITVRNILSQKTQEIFRQFTNRNVSLI